MKYSKAIRFTKARVKDEINCSLMDTLIPEASSSKYFGMILCNDLIWANQINYTEERPGKNYISQYEYLKLGMVIPKS